MSSQRRIESSRANGALSRGPKTPEGRARSRAARLTHGLTSSKIVLEGESENEFRALHNAYIDHYQPSTPVERYWVEQLAAASWRLQRIQSLEADLLSAEMERQAPAVEQEFGARAPQFQLALAFRALVDERRGFATLDRHEARLNHQRNQAEQTLHLLRQARLRAKTKTKKFTMNPDSRPDELL